MDPSEVKTNLTVPDFDGPTSLPCGGRAKRPSNRLSTVGDTQAALSQSRTVRTSESRSVSKAVRYRLTLDASLGAMVQEMRSLLE
jgi:hypothetical protein